MFQNIPDVKLGLVAVSRDCFPIELSIRRRAAIKAAFGDDLYESPVTVENELDMQKAVADVNAAGCNALVVFLGNFGPETPETLLAKYFDGPVMYVAAAEGDGDLINGRGDAYCGMLNCSYNLGMRHLQAHIPSYPVGTAQDIADMIREFVPVARAVIGVKNLKIITFGPRPQDFFALHASAMAARRLSESEMMKQSRDTAIMPSLTSGIFFMICPPSHYLISGNTSFSAGYSFLNF